MKRLAAIDIGSNSVRSMIVEVPDDAPHTLLDEEKAYTRLSHNLNKTGLLTSRAIDESIEALRRMLRIARDFEVDEVRAVATAAVRSAKNGEALIARARDELALEIEVISASEEGRLAFLSAASNTRLHGRCAVFDIGGGSVEIVRSTDLEIEYITSLPLGAVVMSERYHVEDPMRKKSLKRMSRHARSVIADDLGPDPDPVHMMVGSGGTINALAAMTAASRSANGGSLHGFELTQADVIHLLAALSRSTSSERSSMKGLPESRVDIIVAGTAVVAEAMKALGANSLVVNTKGMREGIVLDMIARTRGGSQAHAGMDSVRQFGTRCHYDEQHAEQVRMLSLAIFDQIEDRLPADEDSREMLEAAAILHDVGYHISYEKHHKHSHHLISYSDLPGFTGRQRRMIAAIARYHRGAHPKLRHEAMREMEKSDRRVITALGGILRLADGLDRTRSRRIREISVADEGRVVRIEIAGAEDLEVEVHGAQAKATLLERALGVRIDVSARVSAPRPKADRED